MKVWCVGNTVLTVLIHVYICVDLVKRKVITIVGETPRYRNDSCYSAYHQDSMPTIITVCLPPTQYVNIVYLPSILYTYHQHSMPTIKPVYLPSRQDAYHQTSIPTIKAVYLPSTRCIPTIDTVYLQLTHYIPTINTEHTYNQHSILVINSVFSYNQHNI